MTDQQGGLLDLMFNEQSGGDYRWHRTNAINNLAGVGEAKRDAWLNEVRAVQGETGMMWKDALREASNRRRAANPNYRTWKETTISNYRPRVAANVTCPPDKPNCPGKYDRPATSTFRPGRRNKRPMSEAAAVRVLREHYRNKGEESGDMKAATKAMRQDISKKRNAKRVLQPGSPDSWLYRKNPTGYDMVGVDYGEGRKSPAWGKNKLYSRK